MLADSLRNLLAKARASALARGAATTFVVRVFGAGLIFFTHVFLARKIGVEEYGIYAFTWTWINVLAFLAPLGFDVAMIRFLSSFKVEQRWEKARGALVLGHRTTLLSACVISAIGAGALLLVDPGFSSPYTPALLCAAAAIPFTALMNLHEGIARGMTWVPLVATPTFTLRPVLFLAFASVAIYQLGQPNGQAMAVAFGAACAVTFSVQFTLFRRWLPTEIKRAAPDVHRAEWLRIALPMVLVASFEIMLCNTDVVMMGLFKGPETTGVYSAAVRTSTALSFVFFAVTAFAGPRIAELFAAEDRTELVRFTRQVRAWMFVPTLVLAIGLAAAGDFILGLFKDESFTQAYWPMVILSGVALLRALAGPVDSLLIMTGRERQLAFVLGSAAVLNLVLNAILIPWFGPKGAACATVSSVAVELIFVSSLAGRHAGFIPFRLRPVVS